MWINKLYYTEIKFNGKNNNIISNFYYLIYIYEKINLFHMWKKN